MVSKDKSVLPRRLLYTSVYKCNILIDVILYHKDKSYSSWCTSLNHVQMDAHRCIVSHTPTSLSVRHCPQVIMSYPLSLPSHFLDEALLKGALK